MMLLGAYLAHQKVRDIVIEEDFIDEEIREVVSDIRAVVRGGEDISKSQVARGFLSRRDIEIGEDTFVGAIYRSCQKMALATRLNKLWPIFFGVDSGNADERIRKMKQELEKLDKKGDESDG